MAEVACPWRRHGAVLGVLETSFLSHALGIRQIRDFQLEGSNQWNTASPLKPSELTSLCEAADSLQGMARLFEEVVWFGAGVGKHVSESNQRGWLATLGTTKVLVYSLAGRVLLSLQKGDKQVTLITSDEDSTRRRMGWQSVYADATTIREMFADAVKLTVKSLKPDDKIGIG